MNNDLTSLEVPRTFPEVVGLALRGEWRFDQVLLDEKRLSGCLFGSMGPNGMLFMEMNLLADGVAGVFDPTKVDMGHVSGLMTFIGKDQIHTAPIAEEMGAALGQLILNGCDVPDVSEGPPILSPPWLLDAFLVYRLPTLMPFNYTWEGTTEGDILTLRGARTNGHHLLIKHDTTEKESRMYSRTKVFLMEGDKSMEQINFPITTTFVDTALASWQRQQQGGN